MSKKGQDALEFIHNTRITVKRGMENAKRANRGGAGGTNPFGRRGSYGDIQSAMKILRDAERAVSSEDCISDRQRRNLSSIITRSAESLFNKYVNPGEYSSNQSFFRRGPKTYESAGSPGRVPVMDYINEIERTNFGLVTNSNNGLEESIRYSLFIVTLLAGIFFLSFNITGNAITGLSTNTTSFLGAGLLIVGLVAGFFYIKDKKKNSVVKKRK